MTLDELRTFDIAAAWAHLPPEQQAAIGQATIAWQLASLAADRAVAIDHATEADDMANAAETGVADAVEAALPDIDWRPITGSLSASPTS